MNDGRRKFLSGGFAWFWLERSCAGEQTENPARAAQVNSSGLRFRVAADGWGSATPAEVAAVLQSAAGILWSKFTRNKVEPFVVVRGREGPIVHYQRNIVGEIVMKLDTEDYFWCQYVYQFSHEFCHILCGFDNDEWKRNNWFEETICETASLYVLRRLSEVWTDEPPWPHWKKYAPEFRRYAQTVMDSRSQVGTGHLGDFYRRHRAALERSPRDRSLNGAMALRLLSLFEGAPESWESIAWLNSSPSTEGETFSAYLEKWRAAVPARHRSFVDEVRQRFGLTVAESGAAGPSGPENSRD